MEYVACGGAWCGEKPMKIGFYEEARGPVFGGRTGCARGGRRMSIAHVIFAWAALARRIRSCSV